MAITINGTTGIAGVDGSASTPAVQGADPNTGIFYPAADTIAFAEGGVEAMRITSAGEVLVGGTTAIESAPSIAIQGTNVAGALSLFRSDTSVTIGDQLGQINFYGNDTTSNTPTRLAYIAAAASGDHAAGDNPTDLVFGTTPDGSATVTERMRIDSSGAYIYDYLGVGVAPSTSITITGTKNYTSNAQRIGLNLNTTITSETLTANRINYGIYNTQVVTQDALAFTLSSYGIYNEVYNGSANDVTSNSSSMLASYNLVRNRATGTVAIMYGSINQIQNTRTSSITTDMYSAYNKGDVDLGTVTTWRGTYNWLEQDGGTTTTAIGTYNRLDRDAGTLTNAYGVFNSFEGTIGTKLGYIDSANATVDFGVVGDPLGVTSTSIKFGVVDTTTPSNSRVVGQLQYDTKTNFIIGSNSNVGGAPLAASLIFNTSNSIYDPVTDTGGIFRVKAYENGLGDSLVDFSVEGVVFQTTTRNPTTPILNVNLGANNADSVTIQATDVYVFSSSFNTYTDLGPLNLTGGDIRITGGLTTVFDGTTSGTLSIEQTPSVTYSMTSGNLFVLSGSNSGLTSTTAVNTLRFTDTSGTTLNQPLGKIEFFTSDGSSPGARVVSYILSSALGTAGGGDIRFGTSANAGTVSEAMRITGAGLLQFNSGYGSVATAYGCRAWANFNGVPLTGTYSQTGTTVTVTITAHGMTTGQTASLDFTSGTAVDGSYTVTVTGANTFTVTQASRTTSGNVTLQNFIRGSGNVSSIADNATGEYTINFTTALPDANYSVAGIAVCSSTTNISGGAITIIGTASTGPTTKTTSALKVGTGNDNSGSFIDNADISIVIFR